ncbi:MAG: hypothetical protein IJM31_06485 [Campylobacter sp.]|nr:hypothetical protein [Campylobacter sp.]MBQ7271300.1 hypothetical protein [Campylobacter sp.]MBQ9876710.1 hypothetical protein [Campylobacter sp.]
MQNANIYEIYTTLGISFPEYCYFMALCGCLFGFAFCIAVFMLILNLR